MKNFYSDNCDGLIATNAWQKTNQCNQNPHLFYCWVFSWVILISFGASRWRHVNLYTFTLLKLLYHCDSKKQTKWLIFNVFISTNSNYLPSTSFTLVKFTVSVIDSKDLPFIIFKGKILVLLRNLASTTVQFFLFPFFTPQYNQWISSLLQHPRVPSH